MPATHKPQTGGSTPEQALAQALQVPAAADEAAPAADGDSRQGKPKTPRRPAIKSPAKLGRSKARVFVVQALYQYLVSGNEPASIDQFTRDLSGFDKCNTAHYDLVFYGCVEHAAELNAAIEPLLDRGWSSISPIEHVCMWIGVYEFKYCPEVPWRVVLNECIELAKSFGGTDGHRYVNGVLHALAAQLRPLEVAHDRPGQ